MKKGRTWNGISRQPAPRNVSDRLSAAPKQSGRDRSNDSKLEPSKSLSRSSRHCPLRMTSVLMRVEGLAFFDQKPSSRQAFFSSLIDLWEHRLVLMSELACTQHLTSQSADHGDASRHIETDRGVYTQASCQGGFMSAYFTKVPPLSFKGVDSLGRIRFARCGMIDN